MDENNVRYPAGPTGEGTMHRVGLTRHCLASGLVQLPYALKDALPEGALLAHDLEQDDSIEVFFVAPRRLEGLHAFFRDHELHVNDEIELRVVAGDPPQLKLTPKPRARKAPASSAAARTDEATAPREQETATRSPSVWHSVRDTAAPAARRSAQIERPTTPSQDVEVEATLDRLPQAEKSPQAEQPPSSTPDPDVVERFGSVTVRRLGAGTMPRAAASDLTQAPVQPSSDEARPATTHHDRQHARADGIASYDDDEPPELVLGVDPDEALAADPVMTTDDVSEPLPSELPSFDLPALDPDEPLALDAHVDLAATPQSDELQADEMQADEMHAAEMHAAEAEVRQASLFDRIDPAARDDLSPATPKPAAAPAKTPENRTTPEATTAPEAALTPEPTATPEAIEAPKRHDVASAQRAREEALSRAGDLHSRIVRWLLAPETPVIVSVDQVQEAFDLPNDVARDIVEGILESPPPSLRLTRLRTDLLRVSRITVEQNA